MAICCPLSYINFLSSRGDKIHCGSVLKALASRGEERNEAEEEGAVWVSKI